MNVVLALGISIAAGWMLVQVLVAFGPCCRVGRTRPTRARLHAIDAAVTLWSQDHPRSCPTLERLVESGELERSLPLTDGWGRSYVVRCDRDPIAVLSAGPDGLVGTEDDID